MSDGAQAFWSAVGMAATTILGVMVAVSWLQEIRERIAWRRFERRQARSKGGRMA